jgi:hypothetical protein
MEMAECVDWLIQRCCVQSGATLNTGREAIAARNSRNGIPAAATRSVNEIQVCAAAADQNENATLQAI